MSTVDESKTFGRARLTFANEAEIDEFVATVEKYERGEISPDQWRAYRLVRGTYGQRQAEDAQMLRVKIPQGLLTANQLVALAEVGERYSRGFGHITTRQNVQFHFVKLHDVEPALRRLADEGLTTREACGNSVRNITTCPYAGVAGDEAFDVTPYAEAMTRFLLRHRLSSDAAAQVQDRLRRMPGRPHRHADQRPRLPRGHGAGRRPRFPRHGRRRHGDPGQDRHGAARVRSGVRDLPRRRSGAERLPPAGGLQAQAAQPHEVHDPRARVDAVPGGVRPRAQPQSPDRPRPDAGDRSAGERGEARLAARRRRRSWERLPRASGRSR